ncbi:hypothetical protein SOVF_152580 [Spinacia oleracea]|uniref:C2H2-type domain-containing protein n=1 Tax=Spinacia oleracea TaxID=3562 RepID=A0ABM3RE68_SPIOL|nr:uncharacterized protein LOC110801937 [Spinacia oleracea]KNA09552.1 hypothetical protein SOVF_152580 [Spinacia oleracea]
MGNYFLIAFLLLCFSPSPNWIQASSPGQSQDLEDCTHIRKNQQHEHANEVHCSRERSRAAWKVIDEYLMPFVEKEKYQISNKCRLHPDNDMFRDQELHKINHDVNEWRCGYCKKSFYAEKYIDKHFDNRHYHLLNATEGNCLAYLCGALHCDLVMDLQPRKTKCNPASAVRNRHLCETLADTCFPVTGGLSASRLHEFFLHQFCNAHSCSGGQKPFSRGGKTRTNAFYVVISVLVLMLLPLFYGFVYLYQRGLKMSTQDLRRISRAGRKKKPS